LPIAGLLVAVAAIPAAAGVVHGGRGDARWWRWRAIVRRVRSAWRAVRGGARRMHWAAAAATAAASSAIFLLDAGPWTAGRMAAVAAAVTHTAVNLRQ
jgi:hypothetical protein